MLTQQQHKTSHHLPTNGQVIICQHMLVLAAVSAFNWLLSCQDQAVSHNLASPRPNACCMSDSAPYFFCDEGFLERLLDSHSALARHALQKAVFYVVPNMNPDGSWRGHLRTNAAGANLNREWAKPSLETSPEVTVSICQC